MAKSKPKVDDKAAALFGEVVGDDGGREVSEEVPAGEAATTIEPVPEEENEVEQVGAPSVDELLAVEPFPMPLAPPPPSFQPTFPHEATFVIEEHLNDPKVLRQIVAGEISCVDFSAEHAQARLNSIQAHAEKLKAAQAPPSSSNQIGVGDAEWQAELKQAERDAADANRMLVQMGVEKILNEEQYARAFRVATLFVQIKRLMPWLCSPPGGFGSPELAVALSLLDNSKHWAMMAIIFPNQIQGGV